MADQLTITDTTYTGTVEAGFMITQATFTLDTIQKGVAFVKDGIKKQHNIPKLDIVNPLQARVATPTASGAFNVTGVVLSPHDIMAYTEVRPGDFEAHFYAEQLSQTLLARELPPTASNTMMQLMLNRCFEQIETNIHMGSTGYSATTGAAGNGQLKFFDGIIRQAIVDGTYLAVASPSTITASNILAKFDAAIGLLPKAILSDPKRYQRVKFCVSVVDFQLFEAAATLLTFKGPQLTENIRPQYRGYEVVPLAGMPASTFYLTRAFPDLESNIWIGTNSTEDLMLQLSRLQNNSELYFFKGLFKFDVKIAKMNEFVMHTTLLSTTFTA